MRSSGRHWSKGMKIAGEAQIFDPGFRLAVVVEEGPSS